MPAVAQTGTGNVTGGSAATAGSVTVAKPANTADGDRLVAVIRFQNSAQTITPPSGWTQDFAQTTSWSHAVFHKDIPSAAAETATSYTFTVASGTARIVGMVFRITGAALGVAVDVVGTPSAQTGTTNAVAPAITPARASGLLLAIEVNNVAVGNGAVVTTPPSGMTTVGSASVDNGSQISSVWVGQEQITSTASTGTRTLSHAPSASNSQALLMQIRQGNTPPVVTLTGPQTVAAGATATATATATDDGSIASYAWSVVEAASTAVPTLTGASTATVSFTAPGGAAGYLVVLQCVVTDDAGASTTATTEVRVPIFGGNAIRPAAINYEKTGSWTRVGSATTDGGAITDLSDATYLQSGTVSGVGQAVLIRELPAATRANLKINVRAGTDTGTANMMVQLREGAIVRQTWNQPITATATDYSYDVTNPAGITNWADLWLLIEFTA